MEIYDNKHVDCLLDIVWEGDTLYHMVPAVALICCVSCASCSQLHGLCIDPEWLLLELSENV